MSQNDEMCVIKRNNQKEEVSFDKILNRVKNLGNEAEPPLIVNYSSLVMKVIDQLYPDIPTSVIDELTAEQCASLSTKHPDYGSLASRVIISNNHKNTSKSLKEAVAALWNFKDIHNNQSSLVSDELNNVVEENHEELEKMIDYKRDYLIDYFGFKTLERAYLMRVNNKIVECPQHMWMRVAIGIHGNDLVSVKETYDLMSQKYFTHATPTLYNAGTPRPQLSSCYLIAMEDDSIDGIYNTLHECASISKWAGGIGCHLHNVRAKGSHIRGTNGTSNGIVPMLRVFNMTARYVDQCVTPDTYLYTTSGPMKIQDVMSNETEIINSSGLSEVIENVLEHPYSGEIYKIQTAHSIEPLMITDEHPIYVIPNQSKGLNYDVITNRLDKGLVKPEFKDVKDLTYDDMIIYNIPKYEKDISNINEDDCYMYGVILGDGCMKNDNNTGHITLHTNNKRNIIDFVENYFNNNCIQFSINSEENTTRIRWNKTLNLPFRYADVYDINGEKHVHKKWLNLPLNKIKNIMKGLIDSDGCYYKELVFDSTSRNLIESMRYMFMRCGVLTSGYIRDRVGEKHNTSKGIIENKKISYSLRIPCTEEVIQFINKGELNEHADNKKYVKFFKYNDYLCTRIKDISKTTYNGVLYDLQMKKIHDYTTHNGIIHNGGGKRNGSFAMYLEPWHADIEDFLELKKNHGDEEMRARDLFYALWIPSLFMEKVKTGEDWYLFCPDQCPGLADCYGDDFKELYYKYVEEGKAMKSINARELWYKICDSQMETGTPYLLYKDAANEKSNQKNLGTIKSSNLCCEIMEYSNKEQTAVCNLASIGLSVFVREDKTFDFEKLHEVTKVVTRNLNKVIDVNYYPTEKTKLSNLLHRPIGIGVQGLADAFMLMDIAYHSDEALKLNKDIFETIYHASLEGSNEISKERYENLDAFTKLGLVESLFKNDDRVCQEYLSDIYCVKKNVSLSDMKPIREELDRGKLTGSYSSFMGSPASKGILQFDMWNVTPSDRYDWDSLKEKIIMYGIRNSLLVAPMPTASTAQILGNNECFEPYTSNIYSRRTLAGDFLQINRHLLRDFIKLGIWSEEIKDNIIKNHGSIQQIEGVPDEIKAKYKIVWEIPMKHMIDMSVDRGAYICQSQSLNLWLEDPTYKSLTSMHFYSWQKGLKTGIYYLRRKPKHHPQQFTIAPEKNGEDNHADEPCEMCSG